MFNEQEWLACVRFQVCGTRQVIRTPALSLAASLPEAAVAQPPATVPFKRRVWGLLFNMSLPAYKAYAAKHPVYCCTVGPRELLYVPAGYVVAESINSSGDVMGFRMSLVVPEHPEGVDALAELAKHSGLENAGAVPVGLSALVDLMRRRAPASHGDNPTRKPEPAAKDKARADSLMGSAARGSGTSGAHLAPGAGADEASKTGPAAAVGGGAATGTAASKTAADRIAAALEEGAAKVAAAKAAAAKAAAAKATAAAPDKLKAKAAEQRASAATASAETAATAAAAKAPSVKAPPAKAPATPAKVVFTEAELQASLSSLAEVPAGTAPSAAASSGGKKKESKKTK